MTVGWMYVCRDRRIMDLYRYNRICKKYNSLSVNVHYHGDNSCAIGLPQKFDLFYRIVGRGFARLFPN
jgi:hypothetical protein